MKHLLFALTLVLSGAAGAETVVAVTAVRSQTLLTASHLAVVSRVVPGAVSDPSELIGKETRVTLYPNRPIMPSDVGAPQLVGRNDLVTLNYAQGGLSIVAHARALGIGGMGDTIRVMNLASRSILMGTVTGPGTVTVGDLSND